jgi:hypothetical protein
MRRTRSENRDPNAGYQTFGQLEDMAGYSPALETCSRCKSLIFIAEPSIDSGHKHGETYCRTVRSVA